MKNKKPVIICLIIVLILLLATLGIILANQQSEPDPSEPPATTNPTGANPTDPPIVKSPVDPVSDLQVSTKGVVSFTHVDGLQYQILIDGVAVNVSGVNGQYDIYQQLSDGKDHTVTVKSKENDKYLESEPSNAVKVKSLDTSSVNLSYDAQTQVFSFVESEGFTYKLSVNGEEKDIPEDRNISSLIPVGSTVFIDLVIKGDVSSDAVTLDALLNIITITYHTKITDFALNNGIVTFSELPGFTYNLYNGETLVLENITSGMSIEEVLKSLSGNSANLVLQISGDTEKNTYVLEEDKLSNEVAAKFLGAASVSVSKNNGVISLTINDRINAGIPGLYYQVYINDVLKGSVTSAKADISAMFDKAGKAEVRVQAMADGYYSFNSLSDSVKIDVPDYNRFHYTYDKGKAEIGGVVSDNAASIKVNGSNVSIGTNVKVDLTQSSLKNALIVIENPSNHPAGIATLTVDITSASDPTKFIRIAINSDNGYNTSIYGGYGESFAGSLREHHGLVDASIAQIVDYNILWTAFLLGSEEGDYGASNNWAVEQKMPLVLVYDSGKLCYFTPNGKFVPFADLSKVEGFNAQDFTDATLSYNIGTVRSVTDQGYEKATFTLDFYGTGEDFTDDYNIGSSGLQISGLEANETKGVYLILTPFNTIDVNQGTAEWITMGGTLTTGKITINGVSFEVVIKYAGVKNKVYIDFGTNKNLFDAAVTLGDTMYVTIPKDGTLIGDWDGAITWNMLQTYTICNTPVNGQLGTWQICNHNHTNGLPDASKLPDRVEATINTEQTNKSYIFFTMNQANGFDVENWDVFLTVPAGAKYNDAQLGLKRAGPGLSFYVEGSDKAVVGDIIVFAAGDYYNADTGKGITLTKECRLKWTGEAWVSTSDEYEGPVTPDRVAGSINDPQTGTDSKYIQFTMSQNNGFEADNWDVWLTVPAGAKYNNAALSIKRAGPAGHFYIDNLSAVEGASVGDIIVFAAGDYYNGNTGKGITLSVEQRFKWNGTAWIATTDGYQPPDTSDRVPGSINDPQTGTDSKYIQFTMSQNNGFEADNWDVWLTVPAGAKYNGDPLSLKRAGGAGVFYIDNLSGKDVKIGDIITFAAGDYYNGTTGKGITLAAEQRFKWDGTSWVATTDSFVEPTEFDVTLSEEIKRQRWFSFEVMLEGLGVNLGPASSGVSINGTILLDGVAMAEPWFMVSDYDWGTGNYALEIKTSDGKVWADEAAYNADKAAGTMHQITIKAGTVLTAGGKTYTVTEDANYRLTLENGEYQWKYTTEEYTAPEAPEVTEFDVTLSEEIKRQRWFSFEVMLEGLGVNLGPASSGVSINGTILLDGVAMAEPWFMVSDYDWGTGNYALEIKTSDGKVWADEAAYNADKAAGTMHQITIKAGTVLTAGGKTYTVTEDANYRISLVDGEYLWRYVAE